MPLMISQVEPRFNDFDYKETAVEDHPIGIDDMFLGTREMFQELPRATVGLSAARFRKITVELPVPAVVKLVGYDPRVVKAAEPKEAPGNVDNMIIELQKEVQRTINRDKVADMVAYLHSAVSDGAFGEWAAIDLTTWATPDLSKYQSEHVVRFPFTAHFFVSDGQHRLCALMDFLMLYPELAMRFTQAISISVLPQERVKEWAGQAFHDKNYLATPVAMTKALSVDSRDVHNNLAKQLGEHEVIQEAGGIDDVKQSLTAKSPKFATHAVIFKFVRGFCEGRPGLDKKLSGKPRLTPDSYEQSRRDLFEFVEGLHGALPHWSSDDREEYLSRSSAALQALGVVGHEIYTREKDPTKRREYVVKLGSINWRRDNLPLWRDVIGYVKDGESVISPASSRQSFDATIKLLKEQIGLGKKASGDPALPAT